jgi:hypothetical protein
MPQEFYGNECVPELNAIAKKIMAAHSIPYADVHSWILKKCGGTYSACPLCDNEPWKNPGAPAGAHCGYHYTLAGYEYIVEFLAPIYKAQLGL